MFMVVSMHDCRLVDTYIAYSALDILKKDGKTAIQTCHHTGPTYVHTLHILCTDLQQIPLFASKQLFMKEKELQAPTPRCPKAK